LGKVDIDVWIERNEDPGVIYRPSSMDIDTPIGGKTDLAGRRHFMWASNPNMLGTYTVFASAMTASGAILTSSHPFIVAESLVFTDIANTAKVNLYLNPNKGPDGLRDLYVYLTTQYGTPMISNLKVSIHCEKGRLFYSSTFTGSGSNVGFQDLEISFGNSGVDGLRVTTCRYLSVAGDRITAWPTNNTDDPNPSNWSLTSYSFECAPLEIVSE
jgi:hypothetical protein